MKIKLILLLLIGISSQNVIAQYVYFYAGGSRRMVKDEITIISKDKNKKEITYKMIYDWIRLDLEKDKMHTIIIKSSEFDKETKINIDLSKKDVLFYKIQLEKDAMQLIGELIKEANINARSDYKVLLRQKELEERIKLHPETSWTMEKLKKRFNKKTDSIEGIYELSNSSNQKPKHYVLGMIKTSDNTYDLIHILGEKEEVWSEGDIKGRLTKTGKASVFKLNWYWSNKRLKEGAYLEFYKNVLYLRLSDWDSMSFLKTYPVF